MQTVPEICSGCGSETMVEVDEEALRPRTKRPLPPSVHGEDMKIANIMVPYCEHCKGDRDMKDRDNFSMEDLKKWQDQFRKDYDFLFKDKDDECV